MDSTAPGEGGIWVYCAPCVAARTLAKFAGRRGRVV